MRKEINGYELLKFESLPDVQSEGYYWKHKKSGARVLVLENEDENKVFHITFRTTPTDSTGVPHIMEHSVLCGSRKYPAKDPFVELVKGSLNTFLNAMTYPDKTMYPVASTNDKDFSNLIDVYMDAVLYPNIYKKEQIFRQEGWNYELEDKEKDLIYNGVVYNEMKGAFSSADDVLEREIMNSLFPDTTYGVESGGDPERIPDLTYEGFLDFHRTYYHPSNSYIYLYGNCDMEEKLRYLDEEYLSAYDRKEVDSSIRLQKAFEAPIEICKNYPISENEDTEQNTYLSWNFVTGTSLDVKRALALSVLEYALLTAPGAPLKEALLEAEIGMDVYGSYDSGTYQPVFSVIAKGCELEQKEEFLSIIRRVIEEQVEKGLEEKAILAGINSMEFRFREADYGSYPQGLMYGIDVMDAWLYDENEPFAYLKLIPVFDWLKKQTGTGYYEQVLKEAFLENTHSSILCLVPEKGLTKKKDDELAAKLRSYRETLSEEELDALVARTKALKEYQSEPSTKEELESIPMITVSDIRKEIAPLSNVEYTWNGTKVLYHDYATNGISYLRFLFDLKKVPVEYLPYVGILKAILGEVDTKSYTYDKLWHEINLHTGGLDGGIAVYSGKEKGSYFPYFTAYTRVLSSEIAFAFDMIYEVFLTSDFSSDRRLSETLAQMKSRMENNFVSAGHSTAVGYAMSTFSFGSAFKYQTSGIGLYQLVCELEADFANRKEEIKTILRYLTKQIFTKENLMMSITADAELLGEIESCANAFLERLPENAEESSSSEKLHFNCAKTGFQTSSQVNYVAKAGNFADENLPYVGTLHILRTIMSYDYLWINVRVKGGAYGCMSGFSRTGESYFTSYRDPNITRTLDVYAGIPEYVRTFTVDDRDMEKYIIGTIGTMDTPKNPAAKGERSLTAYICGIDQESLQKERDEVLHADQEAIRALAPYMEAILKKDVICVIGNEEALKQEKEIFEEVRPLIVS